MVDTISLGGWVADQRWYNLETSPDDCRNKAASNPRSHINIHTIK